MSRHIVDAREGFGVLLLESEDDQVYLRLDRISGPWRYMEEVLICWLAYVHGFVKVL